MQLGEYIKQYRRQHGLSQRDFAERCGVSHGYISILEKGRNTNGSIVIPSFRTFKIVADATGITVDELAGICGDQIISQTDPKQLTEREQLIALIDSLPEEKIRAILALLQGL